MTFMTKWRRFSMPHLHREKLSLPGIGKYKLVTYITDDKGSLLWANRIFKYSIVCMGLYLYTYISSSIGS